MHHAIFASQMGIPTYLAYSIEESCNAIIKDSPSHWVQETPFHIFAWSSGVNEQGQHCTMASIGTADALKSGKISDTIPCWQIVELTPDDPAVLALTDAKHTSEELVVLFDQWRQSLDLPDPKVGPIQHRGTLTLLICANTLADRVHVSIHDDGDEVHGPDIQLRLVLEKDDHHSLLIIEPNPYTNRTAAMIGKHLN